MSILRVYNISLVKVVYFGSGELSSLILQELIKFLDISLVITKPDAPKGRGRKISPTPVKEASLKLKLDVKTPTNLKDEGFLNELRNLKPDFILLADYGERIPKEILDIPKYHPLCFHPSLLPKYRGATPIERAFFNCDDHIGLTVFVMNERIDAGIIVLQDTLPFSPCYETKGEVIPRISKKGAQMLYDAVRLIIENKADFKPQKGEVSYAPKLKREEEFVNPSEDFKRCVGRINGLSPKPGARMIWRGKNLKILKAVPYGRCDVSLGEFVFLRKEKKLVLGCSNGCIEIVSIQVEGKRPISGYDFANGYLNVSFQH